MLFENCHPVEAENNVDMLYFHGSFKHFLC